MKLGQVSEIQTNIVGNSPKQLQLNIGKQVWARVLEVRGEELKLALGDTIFIAQSGIKFKQGDNILLKVTNISDNKIFFQILIQVDQRENMILEYIAKHNIPPTERWIKWLQFAAKLHGNTIETFKVAVLIAREGLPLKKKLLDLFTSWLNQEDCSPCADPDIRDMFSMQNWIIKEEIVPGIYNWEYKSTAGNNSPDLSALIWEGETESNLSQKQKIWRLLIRIGQVSEPAFVSITATADKNMWVNFYNLKMAVSDELKLVLSEQGWQIKRWSFISAIDEMVSETGFSCGVDIKG